ncbi:MAG: VanZ family protein [Gammaproteobacteria bacterium]|nr:MAG: VanZ family protein [Gammaproteobacteria bacterium]
MIQLLTLIKNNWGVFTLLSLVVITASSLWPVEKLPLLPGTDKLHHIIAYAILMFPVALRKPEKWMLFGLFFIAYSGGIELVQPYVNRYGEWLDLLANTAGVICGFAVARAANLLIQSELK